jgi:hypothetical protein
MRQGGVPDHGVALRDGADRRFLHAAQMGE